MNRVTLFKCKAYSNHQSGHFNWPGRVTSFRLYSKWFVLPDKTKIIGIFRRYNFPAGGK